MAERESKVDTFVTFVNLCEKLYRNWIT